MTDSSCTVVLTTIGRPELADQLHALANQTRPPDQVVLVNNGSPGSTASLATQWDHRFGELEVVEDRGQASTAYARNVGAQFAKHPILVFLDDDDIAGESYLEHIVPAVADHRFVAARIDLRRLNPPALTTRWRGMQEDSPMDHHNYLPWVVGAAMGVSRSTFELVGGFDPSLRVCEDTDLSWRIILGGFGEPVFESNAVLHYRLRRTSSTVFRQAVTWSATEVELYRRYRDKGFPRPSSQLRRVAAWGSAVVALAPVPTAARRLAAVRILGDRMGHLIGSVRERCLYL